MTEDLVGEGRRGEGWGPHTWEFVHKLGARGWLNPALPVEYGGLGLSNLHTFIVFDETIRKGLTVPQATLFGAHFIGPLLVLFGSQEHKSYFLPRIARGEIEFALGYTEPGAGSDLASVATRATEEDDSYIVNGQKMFPTAGMYAQYIFTLARTDPNVPKHKGLSLFIIDLQSPGIERRPLPCMGVHMTSEVFFDSVRVPKGNLFGEKNHGWRYLMAALDVERIMVSPLPQLELPLGQLIEYARETQYNGRPLARDPIVRQKLAQMAIEIEAARVLRCRAIWMLSEGIIPNYESAMFKVFQREAYQRLAQAGMEILGLYGQLKAGSKWAPLAGELERLYRHRPIASIGAGSSEINRGIIATRGLGLPVQH